MPQTVGRWTAEMARALPDDGNRYEVLDGELFVTPAPRVVHQRAVFAIVFRLGLYLQGSRWAEVLTSPADIEFTPTRLAQPDVFVIPSDPAGRRPTRWSDIRELLLAVEVISPSTALADRQRKRRIYQEEAVGEYWIVDLDARVIERWRQDDERPDILNDQLSWQAASATSPFVLDLPSFFAEVLDR